MAKKNIFKCVHSILINSIFKYDGKWSSYIDDNVTAHSYHSKYCRANIFVKRIISPVESTYEILINFFSKEFYIPDMPEATMIIRYSTLSGTVNSSSIDLTSEKRYYEIIRKIEDNLRETYRIINTSSNGQ